MRNKKITKEDVITELKKLKFGEVKATNLLKKYLDIYEVNCVSDNATAQSIALSIEDAWMQEDNVNA